MIVVAAAAAESASKIHFRLKDVRARDDAWAVNRISQTILK